MSSKLHKILTKRDNLLSLFTIVLALTVIAIDIFGDGLSEDIIDEALLIILGLVALTNIIERESRFGALEANLSALEAEIKERPLFENLHQVPTIQQYMKTSQELFYTGGHLHSLVHNHSNLFVKWIEEGKSLRFLLQDPENDGLKTLQMPCVNYSYKVYIAQLEDTLNTLKALKEKHPSAKLGVRVTNVTPTQSIAIYDGHMGGTQLCMLLHLPNGEATSAPFVRIDKNESGEWFTLFYERYYVMLWNSAEIIIKHPDEPETEVETYKRMHPTAESA